MKPFFVLLFVVLSNVLHAQDKSFQKLIDQTNDYLERYSDLHPMGERYFPIKELPFTKQEIDTIRKLNDSDGLLSTKKDSIDEYELIGIYQEKIINNLYKIIKHKSFLENDITQLLNSHYINVVKSADNKLFNFSFDEQTGGTYISQISIVYFTGLAESPWSVNGEDYYDVYAVFPKDGFGSIDTFQTTEGTKYLLQGGVRGCNTCFGENISLLTFDGNSFVEEFNYSITSRSYEGIISYDPETKTIDVSYTTDDMTGDCSCGSPDDGEIYYGDEKKCECRFEFNGLNYDLVKEYWEINR